MPVLPDIYMFGVWFSIVLAILFISIYAWQVSEQSRQLVNALAATELVLAREQHLTELDGLAAAAAHALGTPLSTISVIARELEREIDPKSPHAEDVRLLREQTQRCRDILAKLNELQAEGEPFDRLPLPIVAAGGRRTAPQFRHRDRCEACRPAQPSPMAARNPAILYGLGNLIENAVDFARDRVEIAADWTGDDGSGRDFRRRAGLRAGGHRPDRRALCAQPRLRRMYAIRRHRHGPWLLHRQDACWSGPAPS